MIVRASQLFIPTLRDAPADAEAVSHKLLVRGGFIRQVSAGLWTFAPLGWRVHRKVEQIIREEMDAIGAQEWFAPVLTPAELWEATGRLAIPEVFHVRDRAGREFVLPMTHEETFTFHARELQSYKELPQSWYHFQTKDRDEPRPRGGLLRVREFIMKDAYSLDRDEAGLEQSFRAHERAYHRIFERCGLEYYAVQAESGMMGGSEALRDGQFVSGANGTGRHLRGVEHGRDFQARFADLRQPKEGDTCPRDGGALRFQVAIEVGHIFKLGTKYSSALDATFLDEDGREKPVVMGSY